MTLVLGVIAAGVIIYGLYRTFCVKNNNLPDLELGNLSNKELNKELIEKSDQIKSDQISEQNDESMINDKSKKVMNDESTEVMNNEVDDESKEMINNKSMINDDSMINDESMINNEDRVDDLWDSYKLEEKYDEMKERIPYLDMDTWKQRIRRRLSETLKNPQYQEDHRKYIDKCRSDKDGKYYAVVEDTVLNLLEYYEQQR